MTRNRFTVALAAALALLLAAGVALVVGRTALRPNTITAYFTSATAIYPGDQVRVAGVRVGTIKDITPQGTRARLVLAVDRDVPIPADARAVIVAQNLVGARYVQLAPAYETSGPVLPDGAVIDTDRTAVPVEWDDVKEQLTRLATDLGPGSDLSASSVGRFIDSAADALDGNGDKLRETIRQLSGLSRTLAEGSGNIVDVIANLQTFVTVLRDSNAQIVSFQNRLATVSSVLDGSRSDLDAALTNLSGAVADVERFVAGSREQTSEQVERLADVVRNLGDRQLELKNLLHVAPNAIGNSYNIYNPDIQSALGGFALHNFSNPLQVVCAAIGAVENATASETARICTEYLGPALRLLNFNYLPFPFNAYLAKSRGVPPPVEPPPSVSAYTGLDGDTPPPPGWGAPPGGQRGSYAPNGLPADPQPALLPGAPVPPPAPFTPSSSAPATLEGMLLPAESTPPPGGTP